MNKNYLSKNHTKDIRVCMKKKTFTNIKQSLKKHQRKKVYESPKSLKESA